MAETTINLSRRVREPHDGLIGARVGLAVVLLVSIALRLILAGRGGQFYSPDESRYVVSRTAAKMFLAGHPRAGMSQLFSSSDHLGFKVLGLVPASIEAKFGEHAFWPAVFFSSFSVGIIYLIWRLVRLLGGSPMEAFFSALLVSACNSFFYYSRHLFPYDAALCFFLVSALLGARNGTRFSFFAGFFAGLGFLTYNGYWVFGGTVLLLSATAHRRTWAVRIGHASVGILGLLLPIIAVIVIGDLLDHDLFRSFVEFSRTSFGGDTGTTWRFVPEYLWLSEHSLIFLWLFAVIVASTTWLAGRLEGRVVLWIAGALIFYTSLVVLSDVCGHFNVGGRHSRPLVLFVCPITGWLLAKLFRRGIWAKSAVAAALLAVVVQAGWNMEVPMNQVFPPQFEIRANSMLLKDEVKDPGLYRILDNADFENEPRYPFKVIDRSPHPVQFRPYSMDGNDWDLRKAFLSHDVSMRLVRLLPEDPEGRPQISRHVGLWAPCLGAIGMKCIFDSEGPNRSQPLVSAGRKGTGDEVFVELLDAQSLRIGFDHWGVGAIYSKRIPCDLKRPHALILSFGSLFPDDDDRLFREHPEWRLLRHVVLIKFDGETVISQKMDAYPAIPQSVVVFHNFIGFSTASRDFSGRYFSVNSIDPSDILPDLRRIAAR